MNVKNCVAVVAGGASGLGEASSRYLVASGARIGILDMNSDLGVRLSAELGENACFVRTDITDDGAVESAVGEIFQRFGAIHVVVNCAGIAGPGKVFSKAKPLPLDSFNQVVQINLIGTFNILRIAVSYLVLNQAQEDGERGVIINTSSVAAFDGQIGQAAYSASKAAIAGMTLPLARELAEYGIRVVAIAPGLFNTPMVAGLPEAARDALSRMPPFPKRMGDPSEYALLVRHIIENRMLNGEVIRLDAAIRMMAK